MPSLSVYCHDCIVVTIHVQCHNYMTEVCVHPCLRQHVRGLCLPPPPPQTVLATAGPASCHTPNLSLKPSSPLSPHHEDSLPSPPPPPSLDLSDLPNNKRIKLDSVVSPGCKPHTLATPSSSSLSGSEVTAVRQLINGGCGLALEVLSIIFLTLLLLPRLPGECRISTASSRPAGSHVD